MGDIKIEYLSGNGSYDSEECLELLEEADVVVTNPPFSLFRDYVKCLMDYGKKFIIIGNMNAITYKEIFPLIKNNELWLGVTNFNKGMYFIVDDDFEYAATYKFERELGGEKVNRVAGVCWFTNVGRTKRNTQLDLYKKYNPEEYPKYDNYDAIEVSKVCEIPMDYEGVMGVPITFLDKYCPEQFEIIGITENADYLKPLYVEGCEKYDKGYVNGKRMYSRLLIKHIFKKHE